MDKRSMLRVSSTTSVKKLASAIMMALENSAQIEVTSIGASAVNTAVKGIASANGLAAMSNHVLKATPFFKIVSLDNVVREGDEGEERTAMVFLVTKEAI